MKPPELVIRPLAAPVPSPLDAVVREEDSHLVLSAEPVPRPSTRPLRAVAAEARRFVPARPGTVVLREGDPLELLAVVHDLHLDPTWREAWVHAALEEALRVAAERDVRALGLPLLGAVHGEMPPYTFLEMLHETLREVAPPRLEHLSLGFPPRVDPRDARGLERLWREA